MDRAVCIPASGREAGNVKNWAAAVPCNMRGARACVGRVARARNWFVMLYLALCEPCQKKLSVPKKGLVVKPTKSNEFNSRCQVDLIDMQTQADNDSKFIMVYQDHLTKFVILRPLKTKRAEEVTYYLLNK